jgi:hypothetical protein
VIRNWSGDLEYWTLLACVLDFGGAAADVNAFLLIPKFNNFFIGALN